jgi:UDP-glucuronate 4-epimerase
METGRTDSGKRAGKILVTGGAGFIGFHLGRALLEEGFSVTAIDNLNDYYDVSLKEARLAILRKYPGFSFEMLNLADMEGMKALFERERPEIVVNLAAQAGVRYSIDHPQAYVESNLIGFFNVLECCRHYPVRHLLFASSSSVYGANKKVPYSTQDKTDQPVSLYAATKKSNELLAYSYCKLYGIPATGLRFFTVYGPYGRPDMAYFSFTRKILKGEAIQIFNYGDMYRDFTYVDDIVKGIRAMLSAAPGEDENGVRYKVYNIGNHRPEKLLDFVAILEECLGKKAQTELLPMQPGDVYQTYADVEELTRDFGFAPDTGLREGLERFVEWYKSYYGERLDG